MKGAKRFFAATISLLVILSTSKGQAQTQGPNGHFYKVVLEPNLLWEEARIKAAQSTFNDQHGYLATISSAAEDQFINSLVQQTGTNAVVWLGGSQQTNATTSTNGWVWVGGEGVIPPVNGGGTYANWLAGEPNNAGGPNSEQFLAMRGNGWSSEADDRHVEGYVIEYPSAGAASRVSIVTVDPVGAEPFPDIPANVATFEFRREGDVSQDLPVFYTVSGTAENGRDYDELARSIIIPAGASSTRLDVIPRPDDPWEVPERMETVGIRLDPSLILTPDAAYTIDPFRREAAAVIYALPAPSGGALQLATPAHGTTYQYGESIVALAALSFSNQVPTLDLYAAEMSTGISNKVATAFQIQRTNELAFYKLMWTNAAPGSYHISALSTNSAAPRLLSPPVYVIVAAPSNTPIVKIRAVPTDSGTAFSDYASGYFEISRAGPTNQNLQVHYAISGDATMEDDYDPIANYVVIGAGRTTARINITAIDDDFLEGNESVTLSLLNSTNTSAYLVDPTSRQASVTIVDADTPPPTLGWEKISPYPTAQTLNSIAFGNGVFVAVGDAHSILYSIDNGVSWAAADAEASAAALVSVQYGNNRFVAVGQGGRSFTSTNGIHWTAHSMGGRHNTMLFGNGLFAAGSEDGIIAVSSDGATWAYNTTAANGPLVLSAFGNGKFLFKERSAESAPFPSTPPAETFVASADGTNWTRYNATVPIPFNCRPPCEYLRDFNGLTFLNGRFYATVRSGTSPQLSSVDGITWTDAAGIGPTEIFPPYNRLKTENGRAFRFGGGGMFSSADLTNWEAHTLPAPELFVRSIAFGNSTYVVVGDRGYIVRGTNLNALARVDSPEKTLHVYGVAANGNVVVGATGDYSNYPKIIVSTNAGRSFVPAPFTASPIALLAIEFNGLFVAAGGDYRAVFSRSADGVTWTESALDSASQLRDLTFANGLWIGVGLAGTIITSPDAANLTARSSGTDVDLFGVASGNGAIIAVGESGAILRSTNGINWTLNGTVEGSLLRGVAFGNGMFVAVGDSGRVYTSANGSTWTARRILGANSLARVAFAHGLFTAIEGNSGKVYVSGDGIAWSSSNLAGASLLGADSSDGKLWVSGENAVIYREQFAGSTSTNNAIVSVEATIAETWEPYPEHIAGKFTLRRTGALDSQLIVNASFAGTATFGGDYTSDTNQIVFQPGESQVERYIEALPDDLVESAETVVIRLGAADSYTVDTNQASATVTILDRDSLPTVSIFATQPDTWEPYPEGAPGAFTIRRTGSVASNMVVVWVAFGGTAKNGLDYTADTNSVEFLPGQSEVIRYITPLADDLVETNETVGMQIIGRGSIYNTDMTNRFATVVIHDRDSLPTISVEAKQADTWEQSGNTLPGQFAIRRTGSTNDAILVYMFLGGTAKNGLDYTGDTNSVEFVAGQTEVIRTITPIDDQLTETNETVFMQIVGRGLVYKTDLSKQRATITIHDGEAPPQPLALKLESCVSTNGALQLTVTTQGGQASVLQRSVDLVNWEDATTITNGAVTFTDQSSAGARAYYRLKVDSSSE
ncbi:MAG TPA: Calx-beta domain-containing protein [Verrucomicrobiae bacterium]|nr:Calx-beta domain-containing protein [Verrucomicrobiae bacterium]